jgi:hypothetical protein
MAAPDVNAGLQPTLHKGELTWGKHQSSMFSWYLEKPHANQTSEASGGSQLRTRTSRPSPRWALSQCSDHTG